MKLMRTTYFIICIFFFLLSLFACSHKEEQTKRDPVYDFSAIDQRITSWIDSAYYPGALLAIAKDNQVIHQKVYGNYTEDEVVYVASAGKWLAAAVIAAIRMIDRVMSIHVGRICAQRALPK